MTTQTAAELVREIAVAHRAEFLRAADHIDVSFSSGGLAFRAKGQAHALARVEARLSPTEQRMTLTGGTPGPWEVVIADGEELSSRLARLRSGRRRVRWRPDDLGTFAAAAIWNYLTLPVLLEQVDRAECAGGGRGLRRLRVKLPPTVAGHGGVQTLHVDDRGLIRRHDYTATAFGRWARATQLVEDHRLLGGVPVGTSRRVVPRLARPVPGPTLVWIRIHSLRLA